MRYSTMKYSVTYYTPNCNIHCLYFNYMQTVCFGTVYYPICTVKIMDRWITRNGELMKNCRIPLCFSTQMLQKHRKTNKQIRYLEIRIQIQALFKVCGKPCHWKPQGVCGCWECPQGMIGIPTGHNGNAHWAYGCPWGYAHRAYWRPQAYGTQYEMGVGTPTWQCPRGIMWMPTGRNVNTHRA